MTTTRTRTDTGITLNGRTVDYLRELLAAVDAAEGATLAAAMAADAATDHDEGQARHSDWKRACRDEDRARGRVVAALRPYRTSGRPA